MEAINSKTHPFVSIVVATYNGESYIANCIKSLLMQSYPHERREIIVVVDPKTSDRTEQIVSEFPVTVLLGPQGGPASCRNEGLENAKGKIVAFIDDDSVADEYWLEKLISHFPDPEIAGVGGRPVDPNEGVFHEYNRIIGGLLSDDPVKAQEDGKIYISKESYITLPTANICYSKKVFREVGGFDTRFKRAAAEDRDLLWKILKKDYKLVYDPTAITYHYGIPSTFRTLVRKTYVMGQERIQFYKKHPDFLNYVKAHKSVKRTLVQFFCLLTLFAVVCIFIPLPYVAAIICIGYIGLTIRYSLKKPKGGIKHAIFFPLLKLATYLAWNLGVIKGKLRYG